MHEETADRLAHSLARPLQSTVVQLARALIRIAPEGLTRVFYSDNGSTAIEVALKMAVQYWQQRRPVGGPKHTFLHLRLAYHGDTVGAVSVGNIELFHSRFKSLLFPTAEADPPYCYRCPLNLTYPSCHMACIDPIEQILKGRHRELAGFILEPLVQAAAGMLTSPPGYLKRIRELCTKYNVLLIADEVATGFGRTGKMFACQHEGITPDLMAISKGLTGGYMPSQHNQHDEIYRLFSKIRDSNILHDTAIRLIRAVRVRWQPGRCSRTDKTSLDCNPRSRRGATLQPLGNCPWG